MSKSVGNVVDPLVEANKFGNDVIRLWVALSDYTQDVRVGSEILKTTKDQYLRFRNTFKFLLDNLSDTEHFIPFSYKKLPPLEKYMVALLQNLRDDVVKAYSEYRFSDAIKTLLDFCSNDLSAFYFDIRKDSLYCDANWVPRRHSCQTVLLKTLEVLSALLRPVLPFLIKEVHLVFAMNGNPDFDDLIGNQWKYVSIPEPVDVNLDNWQLVRDMLAMVTPYLEEKRREGIIGANLDAHVTLSVPMETFITLQTTAVEFEDIFRVSQLTIVPLYKNLAGETVGEITVEVKRAEGTRCARSKKILPTVGEVPGYPDLSPRDALMILDWLARRPGVTL